jgi:hypothetical protein
MRPYVPKFKDTSGFAHMMRFDWALSHRNSDLYIVLEVEQMFWTKIDLINVIKWWHVKKSLQYNV